MRNKLLLGGVLVSFAWNFYLVLGATLNAHSVLTRVAGGHFTSLPLGLRIVYGIQTLLVIYQVYFVIQLYNHDGAWSRNSYLFARIFLALSAVSALVNAVSRSSTERWNALPAIAIAVGFYLLGNVNLRPIK
jgi:hypothetical protein